MEEEKREQAEQVRPAEVRQVEPVADPALAEKADKVLNASTKANGELDILSSEFATDPDLRSSATFNYKRKLILAEVLRLMADSLDPAFRHPERPHRRLRWNGFRLARSVPSAGEK